MKDSIKRKNESEAKLKVLAIPINIYLPTTENEDEVTIRTKEEIVDRIIALTIVVAKAMDASKKEIQEFIEDYDANAKFTEEERNFISEEYPNQEDLIAYSWKIEGIWVLLWSINIIPEMKNPNDVCDVDLVFETVFKHSKQVLLSQADLKSVSDILDNLDFIYRIHWAVRNSQLKNKKDLPEINEGVVYERHYAINWLTNYMDEEWDSVSTDT
jgi:hypothetical protein